MEQRRASNKGLTKEDKVWAWELLSHHNCTVMQASLPALYLTSDTTNPQDQRWRPRRREFSIIFLVNVHLTIVLRIVCLRLRLECLFCWDFQRLIICYSKLKSPRLSLKSASKLRRFERSASLLLPLLARCDIILITRNDALLFRKARYICICAVFN